MTPASEISPELVLVCPELAVRARAAMPDRPWEMFVPRRGVQPVQPVPVAPVASSRPQPGRWLRVVSLVPAALLVAFAALLLVGSISSFGKRPSLAPAPRPASGVVVSPPPTGAATTGAALSHATQRSAQLSRQPAAARP